MIRARITGEGWTRFDAAVKMLGSEKKARAAYRAAINAQGAGLRRQAVRILPTQVGLKKKTISKALGKPVRASNERLLYRISTQGGEISYKYFGARESGSGVVAHPRGAGVFIQSGFTRGGPFGARHAVGLGGHVFAPTAEFLSTSLLTTAGRWGRPIRKLKSDVTIPGEMETGRMLAAFRKIERGLDGEIGKAITRLTRGSVT